MLHLLQPIRMNVTLQPTTMDATLTTTNHNIHYTYCSQPECILLLLQPVTIYNGLTTINLIVHCLSVIYWSIKNIPLIIVMTLRTFIYQSKITNVY